MKLSNNYFILRHGEAISNRDGIISCWPEKKKNPLTERGKKEVRKIIAKLKKEKIDLIFSSDVLRCKETAQMATERLGLKVNFDKRLREVNVGIFNGRPIEEWNDYFKNWVEKFTKRAPGVENRRDIKERIVDFIKDIDKKYKGKNILIVSHEGPLIILQGAIKGFSEEEMIRDKWEKLRINTGEYRKL
jgi:broad specificity phosphatase PhoE